MIHVTYSTNDLYAKFVGISMLSLFENTKENVTVHILHDNTLTLENEEKFIQVAGHYNQQVKFYNVEKLCAAEVAEIQAKFTHGILKIYPAVASFRLFLPKFISPSIKKIIHLDADTVVNLDINELWSIDLQDKPLAAVIHKEDTSNLEICRNGIVKPTDYFNSGVMVMNLEKLAQNANLIRKGVEFISSNPQYIMPDQDILNYCFSTQYLKLPGRFNEFVRTERVEEKNILEPKIYHYTAGKFVYGFDISDVYNRLFWETFMKTPWFSIETFGHLFAALNNYPKENAKLIKEHRNKLIEVSALMSGKTRIFLTDIKNFAMLKEIFAIKDNEEIILLTADTPMIQLADSMNALRDKKIFFLLFAQFEIYNALRDLLKERGLIEGKDFINSIPLLLKPKEMENPFSWEIIKNL